MTLEDAGLYECQVKYFSMGFEKNALECLNILNAIECLKYLKYSLKVKYVV